MSPGLIFAVVTILTAAAIYTVAVFAEHRSGILKPWHLALFWLGFVFDTVSTTVMSELAGGFRFNLHGVLGVIAILLMFVHSTWATIALLMKREDVLRNFHRFSLTVWALWMVSLVTGFVIGIPDMLARAKSGA
jgi:uncharacterized repeat protein (TIGR03987 family)